MDAPDRGAPKDRLDGAGPPATPDRAVRRGAVRLFLVLAAGVALFALLPGHPDEQAVRALGAGMPVFAVAPFAVLLLVIAVAPLALPHRWESHRFKALVAGALSVPAVAYLLWAGGGAGALELVARGREYVSFICLLSSLYVISGGLHVGGSLAGTPLSNTAFLGAGALLASVVGTTGASMLFVRPLLRANVTRERKGHVFVFFIFIVSNAGGMLTPLGDPPLFLGFLKGVPFTWTLGTLVLPWLLANGALLALFFVIDSAIFDAEEKRRPGSQLEEALRHEPLRVEGWRNAALLAGVVAVVYLAGTVEGGWPFGVQEGAMVLLALASWKLTPARLHRANFFSVRPIEEVAVLFAGIFATMGPALLLLNAHGASLGLDRPWQYFWATGSLSSFLDNAPTYLTFAATAAGSLGVPAEGRYLAVLLQTGTGPALLAAVSAGAVLMGANTYIGNGPNFMVKAIAEESGVKMPSFFGYMAWAGAVLVPLWVVVTLVFFRG